MDIFTIKELETAQKSILSTIHKNEKVYETLSQKQAPRVSQMKMVANNLKNFRVMSALLENKIKNCQNNVSSKDLEDALKALPIYIEQIEKIKPKFKEKTPQHTLAVRRIEAYNIASSLIKEELDL